MPTPTLDKTETTSPTSTAATAKKTTVKSAKEQKDSKLRTGWRRLAPKKEGGKFSLVVWAGFFRAVVLVADCLLAFITAMVIIPLLGAWLHEQSGASRGALTAAGTIAMWLMPLLFLVALLAAGEIVLMRAMWRWATRMIARIRDARGEATGADAASTYASRTNDQSKTSRKRSK
ncbi:hypothetical protein ACFWNT_11170 [Streptomyces sp. NPDC058409]|uniref:hypothetical protein n=1 Tax=Streptomyces sp. NPDC058409 TaxID=3346484 RepID=UPI0036613599